MSDSFIEPNDMLAPSDLYSDRDLGTRWEKSIRTLQRMRSRNEGPPWFVIGRSVFYRLGDILDFEENAREGGHNWT